MCYHSFASDQTKVSLAPVSWGSAAPAAIPINRCRRTLIMGMTRRTVLKEGAAAVGTAATPGIFAQQSIKTGAGKFYERGPVRIYYEETGSGFPLLLIP